MSNNAERESAVKRILIYGMPRTGTTRLMHGLVSSLEIPKLGELFHFNNPEIDYRITAKWIDSADPGIVKILSDHVSHANLDDIIQRAKFDEVLITNRFNLTDCCVSHYFTQFVGYHFKQIPQTGAHTSREIPREHIDHWLVYMFEPFQSTLQRWRKYQWNFPVFYYEDLIQDSVIKIDDRNIDLRQTRQPFVASNFDYKQLCLNYQEVENYIQRNIDPC